MPLSPGTRLGPYEIVALIGRGGMGEVYRGIDTRIDRTVAIKVLPAEAQQRGERRVRFEREARAVGRLNHPHICALYDVGSQDAVEFLIMEYLDGETLADRLRRGPIPVGEALPITVGLAQAIACAHDAGILHRDLKPSNVMLTAAGPKLLDFGLARWLDPPDTPGLLGDRPTADGSGGAIVGTFSYMAPEQIEGRPCDERADVFCLGVVIHEMLAARHPFARPGEGGVIAGILTGNPTPLRNDCPDVPPELERLIGTCLAKRPEDRWQHAGDLARELAALARGDSGTTTTAFSRNQGKGNRRWLGAAAIGIAVVGAIATAGVRWTLSSAPSVRNLVILPCRSSGDPTAQAYCDGLTDTLSARMTPFAVSRGLQVTSTLEVRRRNVTDAVQARREFGATLIVEGSVLRAANTLRVNYVLLDAARLRQIDAYSATSPADDPFALQDRVVTWAADVLALNLTPTERQKLTAVGTRAGGALELSLQGRGYLLDYQKHGNVDAAIDVFNRAIALDPRYAVAYAGLGGAFWHRYEATQDVSWIQQARSSCTQALALDPELSSSHVCAGTVALGTGAIDEAVRDFRLALEREPMSDEANLGLARAQAQSGAVVEAEQTYRRAIELRPQYWATHMWLGTFYREHARYQDAVRQYELALSQTPDNARVYYILGGLYASIGRYQDAIDACRKSAELVPSLPAYANWGAALSNLRRFAEAAEKYQEARRIGPEDHKIDGYLARAYFWSGRRADAMALYSKAIELANRTLSINPRDIDTRISLADDYAKVGDRVNAVAELNRLPADLSDPHVLMFGAVVQMDLSNRPAALDWLERAAGHGLVGSELRDWIELDPLKSEPRFAALIAKSAPKESP